MDRSGATIQFNAWDPSHQPMGKGITFTHQEGESLLPCWENIWTARNKQ
mgnify:CR=1 FL=1